MVVDTCLSNLEKIKKEQSKKEGEPIHREIIIIIYKYIYIDR
jgi:hypothetical protein